MTSSNYIFIYNGQGSNLTCVEQTTQNLKKKYGKNYAVIEVDSSYLAREGQPSLYVLPGGKTSVMGNELEKAAQKIIDCVRKGSGMLAFCAGAMVASSHWKYTIPSEDEPYYVGFDKSNPRHRLNLGPTAHGPAFFDNKYQLEDYLKDTVACLADIYLPSENETFKCFWNQGPVLSQELDDDVLLLAQYVSPTNPQVKKIRQAAAVIHSSYQYGNLVFLGVHPELAQWSQNRGYPISERDLEWNDYLFEKSCRLSGLEHPE